MTTQAEFFQTHAVDGNLTDAQMLQMMSLPPGDTSALLDGGMPDAAAPKAEAKPNDAQPATNETKTDDGAKAPEPQAEPDPAKAVLLARDGVHTIDYQKLVDARQGEQHWKAQAAAAQQKLEALQAEAEQRADAGKAPTKQDQAVATAAAAIEQGVDPARFGDFSEAAIAKGLKGLVDEATPTMREQLKAELLAAMRAELKSNLAPIQEHHAKAATDEHHSAIYKAHPDADSIAESKELKDWIEGQPAFARKAYRDVLSPEPGVGGNAQQVIEFFDTFKQATGKTRQQPAAAPASVADAAQAALAKAKAPVPTSLSEIPAGSKAHHDEAEALMEMSDSNTLKSFMGKTPEQIRALLDRTL